jgi:hypothetical protein
MQLVLTILLLRSDSGRFTAVAFVSGMTVVRIAQGLIFGLILNPDQTSVDSDGSGIITSSILLILAVLLFVTAVRAFLTGDDPDAPPPKWMKTIDGVGAGKAFLLGAGLILIGAKFWVFTIGAISVIEEAALGQPQATLVFLGFAVASISIILILLAIAYVLPSRSDALLDSMASWLARNNRYIVIVIGLVFGTWFMVKALNGLGIL